MSLCSVWWKLQDSVRVDDVTQMIEPREKGKGLQKDKVFSSAGCVDDAVHSYKNYRR